MPHRDPLDDVPALFKAGRTNEARALCEARLRENRDDARAHHLLALADYRSGGPERAIRGLRRALELAPDRAVLHADLGRIFAMEDRLEDGRRHLERAVALDPQHHDAWHNLGIVLKRQGEREPAFAAFKQALRIEAKRPKTFMSLGDMLLEDGQKDAALRSFRLAVSADPASAAARAKLAQTLADFRQPDEADRAFREALSLDAADVESWLGLGYLSEDRGDRATAKQCYRRAIALVPGHGFAIGRLLALIGSKADDELVRLASWALDDPAVPDEAKALVGYGLGKVREARENFPGAFDAYTVANQARRRDTGPLDRDALRNRVDRLIRTYDQAALADGGAKGSDSTLPVFIVGMPRSGTTLVEQILASHPLVHGAGELSAITDIAARLGETMECTLLADEARDYLAILREGAPLGCERIVDKAPLNFFHLGLIARLFPRARIIHCTRDPRDVCFSIYAENFAPSQTHATDLADLGFYWGEYRRLMDHWRGVLPLPVLEAPYEETIADLEATARRLCAFIDVPWNESCLDFHANDRAVHTPSRWQVRRPIYGSSVGRWRRFADRLGPLLDALPPSR